MYVECRIIDRLTKLMLETRVPRKNRNEYERKGKDKTDIQNQRRNRKDGNGMGYGANSSLNARKQWRKIQNSDPSVLYPKVERLTELSIRYFEEFAYWVLVILFFCKCMRQVLMHFSRFNTFIFQCSEKYTGYFFSAPSSFNLPTNRTTYKFVQVYKH